MLILSAENAVSSDALEAMMTLLLRALILNTQI